LPTLLPLDAVDIRQRLGLNVRKLRNAEGWSQEDYADRAGIHRTYVSDIERGVRNPTATVIEKLAKPLGVPPGRLLD
jgi:transcriptional regulator with XRE-family HTH domain